MINEYISLQQNINHYSYYVKQLIIGFCEEFQTNKVHSHRLVPVLERLFNKETDKFLSFFKDEKRSVPIQFIHFLSQQGEIIHVGNSYYSLLPERTIKLPDGQYISISALKPPTQNRFGLGQLTDKQLPITLTLNEYIYRPPFEKLLSVYTKKITNNHDIEPKEMMYFTEKGSFKTSTIKNMQEGKFYILYFDREFGNKIKPEKYFAQWKNGEWYVTQIVSNMFVRLRYALRFFGNATLTYQLINHNYGCFEIKLPYSLPREENILLRLIATPNENRWPKSYFTTEDQINNVRSILAYCKLNEEGVVAKNGVLN
ncbi:hypothetical protein IHV12_17680 [Fictibacillus sp. 7GRE50]|uniref:hypothetical protein n=1 Tax=Fictibacillus sp. 7GRE50 TaxID=2745878 RepID=UPI0018CFE930|nr:hypothetical protein [Fictibacillus sp. 7GRE50]MBH0166755.1 hypothetical protein [Fictibacillus sp. 7GRE50]